MLETYLQSKETYARRLDNSSIHLSKPDDDMPKFGGKFLAENVGCPNPFAILLTLWDCFTRKPYKGKSDKV